MTPQAHIAALKALHVAVEIESNKLAGVLSTVKVPDDAAAKTSISGVFKVRCAMQVTAMRLTAMEALGRCECCALAVCSGRTVSASSSLATPQEIQASRSACDAGPNHRSD